MSADTGAPNPLPSLNLVDLWERLVRHFWAMVVWGLLLGVAGYGVSFLIPKTFQAVASILPPEEDEGMSSLQLARRNLTSLGGLGRLSSYFTQVDIAMAVLRSRSMQETIIRRFGLQKVYGKKRMDDAVRALREKTTVKLGTDGTITVAVQDNNAVRAADIANAYIQELDRFNREIRTFQGRRSRVFLERRVAESDSTLRLREAELAAYQRKHGTILVPPDARGGLDTAADLMGRKTAAEIQFELLKQYASPQSEEYRRLEAQVRELRRQVGDLPTGQAGGAELLRDVSMLQQVVVLLRAQLEEARLREAMDTPTIQVLDQASPPERQLWPRRSWIAAFGLLLGALVGFTRGGVLRGRGRARPATA